MSYLELAGITLAVFVFLFAVGFCAMSIIKSVDSEA